MSLESMVMFFESLLGTKGRPNKITQWYANRQGSYFATAPWCNMAVTYVAYHSGNYDAVCFGKDYAYTVWHAEEFKRKGQWYTDTAGIRRGDIVFFDWGGSNSISAIDHIGVVTGVNGRDVLTIEGNTDDAVRRRVRTAAEIVGYGRPNYPLTARPGPAETTKDSEVPSTYTPPAFPAGLAPNKSNPSAKGLQQALKDAGYMPKSVALADNYGPATQAAVAAFYKANTHLSNTSYDIAIGPLGWAELHREAYGSTATTPPPPPPPTTTPPPTAKEIFFEDVGTYGTVAANKVVQEALNKWKSSPALLVDGIFGPKTSARYKEWQVSLYGVGPSSDGIPGVDSLTKLGQRSAYPFTVKRKPVANDNEPAHDYTRVTYGGKRVNQRTKVILERAAAIFGQGFTLIQGSYNKGVSASAGTHDGGGVVDISVSGWSRSKMDNAVQALRKAGMAAWLRTPSDGFSYHIHGVAIGDREMSSAAKSQIQQWREDRNGLANRAKDPYADPYPAWTNKYR
jgi:peptidoglycan hydrolase-like protein with peptidoglycan-binding domain